MTSSATRALLLVAVAATAAACGSSSSPATGPGTTVTPNLYLQGTITARATAGAAPSIQVNGVTVSTSSATTRIEKVEKPESELKVGMLVKVKAHRATAGSHEAEGVEVEFEDAVTGDVSGKDAVAGTLSVGGQAVRIDDSTEFEDDTARLGSLDDGQRVRVSAVADDRGGLRATRIDKVGAPSSAADSFQVKGVVSAKTASGFTLTSGPGAAFQVTLASGVTIPANVVDGSLVEVHASGPAQAGAILATLVTFEDRLPGQVNSETEIEGIVLSGTDASFVVNGTTVTTTASTTWTGGLPGDLLPGVKVEAEGTLGSDGVLAAHKVVFKASARLIGVAKIDPGTGKLTVNGVAVLIDVLTSPADSIADTDWVEVRGALNRAGTAVVATRAELKSAGGNARPEIRGLVTAVDAAAGTLTVLGQVITTSGSTEFRGHSDVSGVDGPLLTRADFFAAVTAGLDLVKATGQNNADWTAGVSGAARSLELEGER